MNPSSPDGLRGRQPRLSAAKRSLLGVRMRESVGAAEPVAIVGMACRFPGASDPHQLWKLLCASESPVAEIPRSRWDVDGFYHPSPGIPGKMNSRWGGFLPDIEGFDAAFFGVTRREAASMDPQQRLVLEVCWEALENAGQRPDRLEGTSTGIFIGICRNDYGQIHGLAEHPDRMDAYFGTGNSPSFACGRVSYLLGLRGPSLAIDTTCSSSLVAVHLACQSLWARESWMALAGGVNIILSPLVNVYLSQVRAFAPDGRCKAFDESADGYVRAEGCGVVTLKLLTDAVRDGDPIVALIRGSAVNHDGRSCGMTAPSGPAQEEVLRKALSVAAVPPHHVDFVEAHGTGTHLGDPIEVGALASVYAGPERHEPLLIGSIKSSLGHLEAAAGVAGLIKAALILRHRKAPPQVNFDRPSSRIDWAHGLIEVATSPREWTTDGIARLAGVSSFGFSGTNAHVVLEEAPIVEPAPAAPATQEWLLPLSARSAAGLGAVRAQWDAYLGETSEPAAAIGYTAALRRSHHRHRATVVGRGPDAWRAALARTTGRAAAEGVPRLGWIFAGQGPQSDRMGCDLWREETAFRHAVAAAAEALAHAGWTRPGLFEQPLSADEQEDSAVIQPALFSLQWGLAAVWRRWGIGPEAVVGHSLGEVAAACVAGALTLADGARVVVERSRLLAGRRGQGAMVAVELGPAVVQQRIAGWAPDIELAVWNSPTSCVVSGVRPAVEAWITATEADGVRCRRLRTSGVAGHSACVAGLDEELAARLADLQPRRATVRYLSSVDGREVDGEALDAQYWGRNLREPVRFAAAVEAGFASGVTGCVELSPHPVLTLAVAECAGDRRVVAVGSLTREVSERRALLESAGRLWEAGAELDWAALYGTRGRVVSLPDYPWQRQRFWIDSPTATPATAPARPVLWSEADIAANPDVRRTVDGILERWSIEGVHAINRRLLAPLVFLAEDGGSLAYVSLQDRSLLALFYAGAADRFHPTVGELQTFCDSRQYQLTVLTTEDMITGLQSRGFTTTPFGVLQTLDNLDAFSLEGGPMRRLRYHVTRYARLGNCALREYSGKTDGRRRELIGLVHRWAAHRGNAGPVADRTAALVGEAASPHRIFLVERDDRLEAALVLSPAGVRDGYLLDLEFYAADVPGGCLEWGTAELIGRLRAEGRRYLSLGGTFGTQLEAGAGSDPDLVTELEQLRATGVLNGDSNYQFKSKFRPVVTRLFLCRPKGAGASVAGLLGALSGAPSRGDRQGPPPSFLGGRLDLTTEDIVFETRIGDSVHPFLADHRVGGSIIVPGALYVRQALEAGAEMFEANAVEMFDIAIQAPMLLDAGEQRVVQTVLRRCGDSCTFRIASRAASGWVVHAAGSLRRGDPACRQVELTNLRDQVRDEVPLEQVYSDLAARGVTYGSAFRRLEQVFTTGDQRLARVQAPREWRAAGELHPVVLDACFQSIAAEAARPAGASSQTYLLRGVEVFTVRGAVPERFWCHSVIEPARDGDSAWFADLRLIDDRGTVFAEARNLCAKPASRHAMSPPRGETEAWLHTLEWTELPSATPAAPGKRAGAWLVLSEDQALIDALARVCGETGRLCIPSVPILGRLAERIADATAAIAIDAILLAPSPTAGALDLETAPSACALMRGTVHAMLAQVKTAGTKLWTLTRQGVATEVGEDADPGHAALWGYGRVLALEHAELWGGLIDIAAEPATASAAAAIAATIFSDAREDQVAIRGGRRLGARLRQNRAVSRHPSGSGGTFLITGGFGGLGLATAQWLARNGAASHIVLAGRAGPSAEARRVLDGLSGVAIECVEADVSDAVQVAMLVRTANRRDDLAGVIHSVGVLRDGLILRQPWEEFQEVFAAKALGAWHLHQHTAGCPLRRFITYSSAAAVLGSPAQSAHAAANAFLDALAWRRRAAGLPGLSINWGPWASVGGAAGGTVAERVRAHGVTPFDPQDGAEILGALFDCSGAQAIALRVDWGRWRESFGDDQPPLFARVLAGTPRRAPVDAGAPLSLDDRVQREIAAVIGERQSSIPLDVPISSLGLDSIMIVELRDRLEPSCGIRIPLALFFREPSGRDIVRELNRLRGAAGDQPLAGLSDADVDTMLRQALAGSPVTTDAP